MCFSIDIELLHDKRCSGIDSRAAFLLGIAHGMTVRLRSDLIGGFIDPIRRDCDETTERRKRR